MLNKLEEVVDRFREVEGLLSDPTVVNDQNRYRALTKEHAELIDVVSSYDRYCQVRQELAGSQELLKDPDPDVRDMAGAEVADLQAEKNQIEAQLKLMLLPKDPNDSRNVILEVRAGTGGDEAALFAGDLFRMYTRYAENRGWTVELLSSAESVGRTEVYDLRLAAGLLLVLALPTLIRANIASRLDAAGLRLEQFELAGPGLAETRVRRALIGSDDGSRYEIDNLVARYSLDGLMLGRLEQVTADELSIRPSTQTQPLTELLQALFGLMEQDLNTAMPVDRLHPEIRKVIEYRRRGDPKGSRDDQPEKSPGG